MEENLWSISIDPDESMREYVLLQLKVRAMRDMLFRSRIFNYLAAATPGLKELVTIGKIWELAQLDRKVKSGAQVRPRDRRRPRDRPRRRLPADAAHLRRHRPGRPDPLPGRAARPPHHRPRAHRDRDRRPAGGDAGQRDGRARARPARRGRGRRRPHLHERALPGALLQGRGRAAGELAGSENGAVRAAARAAVSEHGRARSQRAQLARLRRRVEAPVKTLPFLFEPELGVEAALPLSRRLS